MVPNEHTAQRLPPQVRALCYSHICLSHAVPSLTYLIAEAGCPSWQSSGMFAGIATSSFPEEEAADIKLFEHRLTIKQRT